MSRPEKRDLGPLSSECPKCGEERVVTYTRDEVVELLREGGDIECYCVSCDSSWVLSTDERADILRELERSGTR